MTGMKILTILLIVCLSSVAGSVVLADDKSEAIELFDQGAAAFDTGRFTEAADLFRAAYNIRPNWKLYYNIGQAEAAAKRFGLALDAFEAYLAKGGDQISEERLVEVHEEVRRLRNVSGALEVVATAGCTVIIDNVVRGTTPLPGSLRIAAGVTHDVRILHDNQEIYSGTVKVSGAETRKLTLADDGSEQDSAASPVSPSDSAASSVSPPLTENKQPAVNPGRKLRIAGAAVLASGALALAGGGITLGIAVKKRSDFYDECGEDAATACSSTSKRNLNDSKTAGNIATALFITGGVLSATGVVLLIVGKKAGKKQNGKAMAAPVVTPGFAGIQLSGTF